MSGAYPTAVVWDACLRLGCPAHVAPPGLRPLNPASRLSGRVRPVQHFGSVDIFLEAIGSAQRADVLVIDNQKRMDEGCVGDLVTLEAKMAGLQGIVIWGCNRDSADILEIGLPLFSYGAVPSGPLRLDDRSNTAHQLARFGDFAVTGEDWAVADADGAIFFPATQCENVLQVARGIWSAEREQVERVRSGRSLREQFQFPEYLSERSRNTSYTFRDHLRRLNRNIEE